MPVDQAARKECPIPGRDFSFPARSSPATNLGNVFWHLHLHLENKRAPLPTPIPHPNPKPSLIAFSYCSISLYSGTSTVLTAGGFQLPCVIFILQLSPVPMTFVTNFHKVKSQRSFFVHFETLSSVDFHDTSFSIFLLLLCPTAVTFLQSFKFSSFFTRPLNVGTLRI